MTTWKYSGNHRVTLKQKLLANDEFNFSNKHLWKLPEISTKFKSVSPLFSPARIRDDETLRTRKSFVPTLGEIEKMPELKVIDSGVCEKPPQFLIEGTQKIYNRQNFRKTFLGKIELAKQTPQNIRKVSAFEEIHLEAWEVY